MLGEDGAGVVAFDDDLGVVERTTSGSSGGALGSSVGMTGVAG
jgi:hypothetical protein